MSLSTLRTWIGTVLDTATSTISGPPLTLRQAVVAGQAASVADILNRIDPAVTVIRGVVSAVAFNADYTAGMAAQLTATERNTLAAWLAAGEIDLAGSAIQPVLARIGYPATRAGSQAESHLGRPVTEAEVEDRLIAWGDRPARVRVEDRLVCEVSGAVSIATYDNGVERSRRATGKSLPLAWASVTLTEGQILRALQGIQPA